METKTYLIHYQKIQVFSTEVEASSEEEAMAIAQERAGYEDDGEAESTTWDYFEIVA